MAVIFGSWNPLANSEMKSSFLSAEEISSAEEMWRFAKDSGINELPIDLEKLVEKLSIQLKKKSLDDEISGELYRDQEEGNWVIVVNRNQTEARQRFTIAHELGHYVLHRNESDVFEDEIFFRSDEKDLSEYQADNFAAELLMPKELFASALNEKGCSIETLAKKFGVSYVATRIRLNNIIS